MNPKIEFVEAEFYVELKSYSCLKSVPSEFVSADTTDLVDPDRSLPTVYIPFKFTLYAC